MTKEFKVAINKVCMKYIDKVLANIDDKSIAPEVVQEDMRVLNHVIRIIDTINAPNGNEDDRSIDAD